MDTVIISPAFQVRLPKHIREALGLGPGHRLRIVQYGGRIELVPLRPVVEGSVLFGEGRAVSRPGTEIPGSAGSA